MAEDELLTIPQAADEFGVKPGTLYKAAQRGRLPYIVKFGLWLVTRGAVKAWKEDPTKHQKGNPNFSK